VLRVAMPHVVRQRRRRALDQPRDEFQRHQGRPVAHANLAILARRMNKPPHRAR
jgi:hypothetical protein